MPKIKDLNIQKILEMSLVIILVIIALFIGYGSFSSGTKDTRDAKRLSDILSLHDSLKVYYAKNTAFPEPENMVHVTSSGEILTSQGYAGESTFKTLSVPEVKDPLGDKNFQYLNDYTFAIDKSGKKVQVMAFVENKDQVSYNPLESRTPLSYGDAVGIAVENKTNRPLQETKLSIDIMKTLESYSLYFSDKQVISGDYTVLKVLMAQTPESKSLSCKEISSAGVKQSGYYYLNPLAYSAYEKFSKPFLAYCDMESDGGGWTRLNYKTGKESCFNDGVAYNKFMIEKLFTTDFAVSDNTGTLLSTGSWILHNVKVNEKGFDTTKLMNVANCKTPLGTDWNMNYGENDETGDTSFLTFNGNFSTLGNWTSMFYGCGKYAQVGTDLSFRIGGRIGHTGEFISASCNDYSDKDHSITSRWDWDNTRVLWVR